MSNRERKRDPVTIPTVATARRFHTTEVYQGLELNASSARPGAYDAFTLPSIYHGRAVTPPPSAALTTVAQAREQKARERKPYVVRDGSVADRVIAHLQQAGGHLTFGNIAAIFALRVTSVAGTLKPAIDGGALIRHTIHARSAVALPGYVPPDDAHEATPAQIEMARRLEGSAPKNH